jgi:hypothetical protein
MGGESETLNAEGTEKFKTGKLAEALALFTRVRARAYCAAQDACAS